MERIEKKVMILDGGAAHAMAIAECQKKSGYAVAVACGEVLKAIGWVAFADFDLIEDPGTKEFLIMEMNPRIPACVRSAFKSGVDYATMIANVTLGQPRTTIPTFPANA